MPDLKGRRHGVRSGRDGGACGCLQWGRHGACRIRHIHLGGTERCHHRGAPRCARAATGHRITDDHRRQRQLSGAPADAATSEAADGDQHRRRAHLGAVAALSGSGGIRPATSVRFALSPPCRHAVGSPVRRRAADSMGDAAALLTGRAGCARRRRTGGPTACRDRVRVGTRRGRCRAEPRDATDCGSVGRLRPRVLVPAAPDRRGAGSRRRRHRGRA